tara:strand:- start:3506 stop:3664 length:159 start_codon:yes stop_codon:yes gene_type:complete
MIIKLIIIIILLTGCAVTSDSPGIGYWKDTYPSNISEWQCIEPFTPHINKEC